MVLVHEWIRERFWAVPTVLLTAGVALGVAVSRVESIPGLALVGGGLPIRTGSAEALLGIIAASMLTFVGVVFTITLVALQLASAQLSPRVIRTFVRSAITKVAFGLFLATFGYAIVVIVVEGASSDPAVLRLAVTLGVALVLASLGVFVVYVTATMRLLQVSWVVTAVADETRHAISANRPTEGDYISVAAPRTPDRNPQLVLLPEEMKNDARGRFGVILGIDRGRLVQLGQQYDCLLQFLPEVGQYLPPGSAIFAVHGGDAPPDDALRACVHLGRARTMYQDPFFGIRQLVDVASQALSPAVNQPTTAVIVIDRLEELLLRVGRRPHPTGMFTDVTMSYGSCTLNPHGARSSTWRSPRLPSTGRRRPRSPAGCVRHTAFSASRSPTSCGSTSIGTVLCSRCSPARRCCPIIRCPSRKQIHAGWADGPTVDDAAIERSPAGVVHPFWPSSR